MPNTVSKRQKEKTEKEAVTGQVKQLLKTRKEAGQEQIIKKRELVCRNL